MVFVVSFITYLATLCPTVSVGDSGELIAAAHVLGVPHPTGYPLYLISLKLFSTLVPIGSVAFRANLFSALCMAAGAQVLASTVRRLTGNRWAAWGAGLSLAFLEPIWSQATVARTYGMAALFTAILLWLMVRWKESPGLKFWGWHNLVLGFALANHPMVIAHVPAFLVLGTLRSPKQFWNVRSLLLGGLLVLPGLAVYAYVPIRAAADPVMEYSVPVQTDNGTQMQDVESFANLRRYLGRETHHGHRWVEGPLDYGRILGHHLWLVVREFWFVGMLLIGWGVLTLRKGGSAWLSLSLGVLWLVNLAPLAWHGAWWDIFLYPRYMTSGWVALALLLGAGLAALPKRGVAPVTILLVLLMGGLNYARCDRRGETLAEDYARAIFDELPEGAQLGSAADNSFFPMMYLHFVEGVRPDVTLVNEVSLQHGVDLSRPVWSPDLQLPPAYRHLRSRRSVLAQQWVSPQTRLPPVMPFTPPDIPALDDPMSLDAIGRSVVSQIHADLAIAYQLRANIDKAREHLDRVAEIPAPRNWGPVRATELCFHLAKMMIGRSYQDFEAAHADLERAERIIHLIHQNCDPKDDAARIFGRMLEGYRHLVTSAEHSAAQRWDEGFEELTLAVRLLPHETFRQKQYSEYLVKRSRKQEAIEHLRAIVKENPHPSLTEYLNQLETDPSPIPGLVIPPDSEVDPFVPANERKYPEGVVPPKDDTMESAKEALDRQGGSQGDGSDDG